MTDKAEFATTAEVAEMLGKTIATINRWASNGRLPVAQRLPGRTGANLFDRRTIQRLARK